MRGDVEEVLAQQVRVEGTDARADRGHVDADFDLAGLAGQGRTLAWLLGALLLKEAFTLRRALGTCLIVASVMAIRLAGAVLLPV
jgi:hypothetical protein